MSQTMPRVSVVVVSYNSEGLLADFFASLPDALSGIDQYEVIVADNASVDRSVDLARELWPDVKIVELESNRGYAAGINTAVRVAAPDSHILVLNDDTRMGRGSIRRLVEALDEPGVSITVPRLKDGDGRLLKSLKREPTPLRALGEVVQDESAYSRPTRSAWASGCAWLIDRECWDAMGGWDESFFLYAEETEYALRCRDAGGHLMLVPDAEAVHPAAGRSQRDPRLWSMNVWNKYRLYRRRHDRISSALFWLALALNEGLRAAIGRRVHRAGLMALLSASHRPVEVRGEFANHIADPGRHIRPQPRL